MGADEQTEFSEFTLEMPYDLGRYRLETEIGRGGMGIVYLGQDTLLERPVAVKVLIPQLAADRQFVQRFTREAQMAARLEHPNIVTVHDVGQANNLVYFVMRMVVGKPMDRLLHEGLTWTEGEPIALQIAEALAYAHAHGVIHRDIKPENVIVGSDGTVTITDFGLARPEQQSGGPTRAGVILGTPDYMPPEQALGEEVDARADIYSFGVMLFEMLTGRLPFAGNSPLAVINQHINAAPPRVTSVRADVPPYLDNLVARLLEKDPHKRPASMTEVSEGLRGQIGAVAEEAEKVEGHDIVARVRRGEVNLATALQDHPEQAVVLEKLFRKELTAASFDLVGSTKLKQTGGGTVALGPVFNRYRQLVDGLLKEQDCLDVVWAGDGTVALFELPRQAIAASQGIVKGLREVNREFPEAPALEVRIGVHTGTILRDPNQTLGQVTSRTLDITGHIQKDAQPGLVEISETTLDKLAGAEGFVPMRKAREGGLTIYAWHPDGPENVPQGWRARMVQAITGGGAERPSGEITGARRTEGGTLRASRSTQETQQATKQTVPEQLTCFYCHAPVRVQDQQCPSCGRLNRHYDPNVDDKGRRRKPAPVVAQPKAAAAVRKPVAAGAKPAAAGKPGAAGQAGAAPDKKLDIVPLITGITISVVVWLGWAATIHYFGGQMAFLYDGPGHLKVWAPFVPVPLLLIMAYSEAGVTPASAMGIVIGMIVSYFIAPALFPPAGAS
jgi:class 3 adenylate cyclase